MYDALVSTVRPSTTSSPVDRMATEWAEPKLSAFWNWSATHSPQPSHHFRFFYAPGDRLSSRRGNETQKAGCRRAIAIRTPSPWGKAHGPTDVGHALQRSESRAVEPMRKTTAVTTSKAKNIQPLSVGIPPVKATIKRPAAAPTKTKPTVASIGPAEAP